MASCEMTFRSAELQMDVKVTVVIPENRKKYEKIEGKKYKSLYILHGFTEDSSSWMNSSTIYLNTRDLDCYVFMVSAYNSAYVDTKWGFKMHTYLTKELPIRMGNIFPLSEKKEDRFLMGESMGGFGTWYNGFTCYDLYSKIVPLSLGLGTEDQPFLLQPHLVDDPNSEQYNIHKLVKKLHDQGADLPEVYTMCGKQDRSYLTTQQFVAYCHENCPNLKIKEEYWDGKHDFYFWNQAIPKALEFFGLTTNAENIAQL